MPRTRASAKAAGTRHESNVVAYLAAHVDDRIERRRAATSYRPAATGYHTRPRPGWAGESKEMSDADE